MSLSQCSRAKVSYARSDGPVDVADVIGRARSRSVGRDGVYRAQRAGRVRLPRVKVPSKSANCGR